ncbi:hypothetical protein HYT25_00945 [Candidatus Pacearchaeota archaeon]|nr:hypothetical protein [Candidatus Pacearchaeota archaeon]
MENLQTESKLSPLEKTGYFSIGIATGFLPPRLQLKITKGNEEAAHYMSLSSRIAQGLFSLYAPTSLGSKLFGADIDPTPFEILGIASVVSALDWVVREGLKRFKYVVENPFNKPYEAWGEPFFSVRDAIRHREWYERH